jgi:transcription-repair coupling factor (superfamily II helicase)
MVVAPVLAVIQGLPPDLGLHQPLSISAGRTLSLQSLGGQLAELGYSRVDVVEHRGEFAVRGGIVDLFPPTARRPIRVDFWGDDVESVREFSAATQLSTGKLDAVEVHPVLELLVSEEVRRAADRAVGRYKGHFRAILERLAQGMAFEGMEQAVPLLYDRLPFLADLMPPGSWVVLAGARRVADRSQYIVEEADALADASGWPGTRAVFELDPALGSRPRVNLSEFAEPTIPDLGIAPWDQPTRLDALLERLRSLRSTGATVVLAAEGRGSLDRALEVLEPAGITDALAVEAPIAEGFSFQPNPAAPPTLALVTEEDLFGQRRHTREAPRLSQRRSEAVAVELTPGDLAVHRVHGVGRYVGMVRRAVAGSERDYLLLEYAAGDKLYVPSDQVGVVAKYIGGEGPRIHRLGSGDWVKSTGRVRRAVRDMAADLMRLFSVRMSNPGHAFAPDTPWQAELEEAFPHEETHDQLGAIEEVKRDMEVPAPMDRLICGDVGYGKTEIAVRAAFKAVMDGKQVAVMVPTTLLAEQHYVTFSERFAPFPVTTKMLSRFVPPKEQGAILAEAAEGKADVLIGTHRLLSSDVAFKDLGLLIVDEEQRFGVAHKERLKRLRATVDVLTMTATPIPRTLEMALAGIREMSTVDTPPEDRQPVLTYVGPFDEEMAVAAVRRELLRGGQVFWVHNRVQTIERRAAELRQRLGEEARVVVAHGQMDEERLEKVMMEFWDRSSDVLVCSTIIESGLDVPSANTLVVERADRLGLAQLYQLRGRVGRSADRAFAYFFFPPQAALTDEAHERLAAISRFTALGSGFAIAMRDLEIRGAGNLLGAEQHGHIAAVGFDTYVRLLQEELAAMKGEAVEPEREVKIDLPVKAFLPPEWVGQEALRLELYRRIATAKDDELARVRAEAEDRFGDFPPPVRTLFAVAELRLLALRLGIEEIGTVRNQIRIRPVDPGPGHERDLSVDEATYHEATKTLNLQYPIRLGGEDLAHWIHAALTGASPSLED